MKLQTHFFREYFLVATLSLYLWLSVWVDIYIIKSIRRASPKVKNSVICPKFQMGSKIRFSQWKQISPNSLIISWKLRKWNISFIMLRLKCGQPCVNSLSYLQQWNLNLDISFPNSSIDLKLGVLNLGLTLYFQVFPNLQKNWKL